MATLTVAYIANVFGPPPPNLTAGAAAGVVLTPLLWYWGNRSSPA